MITFPFARCKPFCLGELRAFERRLLASRRADLELAAWLNEPTGSERGWVKDRADELIPIYMLGEHLGLPDQTGILWRDKPDFILTHAGGEEQIEVTTTSPRWVDDVEHGHQRAIEGELRNKGVARIGHVFSRDQDVDGGVALGRVTAVMSSQRDRACERGLIEALERKNKGTFDTLECTLLVYCSGYGVQTIDGEFPGIVKRVAISVKRPPFARIMAIHERKDGGDGFQDMTWLPWQS